MVLDCHFLFALISMIIQGDWIIGELLHAAMVQNPTQPTNYP